MPPGIVNAFRVPLSRSHFGVGCFNLVLSHPDIKEVWVIIGAVIQYWFSRATNGNGNGAK